MPNNKQIGHILFNKIFLGYVFIAIIFTSYHIYAQYSLAKNSVLKDMQTIEKAFYNGLANSIWHLDEKQIKSNAQAIESIQGIVGVSIVSANSEVFSQRGILSLEDKKYDVFLYEKNNNIQFSNKLIGHSFDIIHEEFSSGEVLGTVSIYTSADAIYTIVKESLIFILVYTVIIVMVLWILFNHFAKKLLTNPLHQIIQATQELDIKEYKEISLDHNDKNRSELDTLVDTFNNMAKRINDSFNRLQTLTVKLNEQKEELIEANQYQTDFLANMSHELKTPLNSINIISSVMAKNTKNDLEEKHVKNLNIINKSGNELLILINDILDISKMEAGQLGIYFERANIVNLMDELYDMMNPIALDKGITLIKTIQLDDNIIVSDSKRIQQIIQNLLSNAIKFTAVGKVSLYVSENLTQVIIEVQDSGIGISNDKLEHIFDRFKQVDGSTTRKYGGTGLGLAISKELSLLIGGELSVSSEVDKGSLFKLTLPKKAEISKICDDTITLKVSDSKKCEINNIELFPQNQEKEVYAKQQVVLFNNNPIEFFGLIVALKKVENIELILVKSEFELTEEIKKMKDAILIYDVDSNTLDVKRIKNTIIGISSSQQQESIDILLPKPIDIGRLMNVIEEKGITNG